MTAPHDRPTAEELIVAVREFIETDVIGATDGRVRFHARVAANVLAMVERELADHGVATSAHEARLARFGVSDDTALAAAIRAGELDDLWDEVLEALRETVRDKLSVANPGYAPME